MNIFPLDSPNQKYAKENKRETPSEALISRNKLTVTFHSISNLNITLYNSNKSHIAVVLRVYSLLTLFEHRVFCRSNAEISGNEVMLEENALLIQYH